MLYSKLGDTGLIVSRLSLGTMTFAGETPNSVAKTTEAEADRLVGQAIDGGINFFDTADVYSGGASETMLGKVLGSRRDEVVIATKAGWRTGAPLNRSGLSAQHLLWSIEQSLRRLGTGHVDVYLAHRNDANTPLEETLRTLDTIVRHGKARYIGFSNWPAWKVAAAMELQRANGLVPFTHGQMMYSLLGRDIEHEILPMAQRYGLGLTAWSPLAGGFLSGKYTRENLSDPANRLSGFDMIPFDKDKGFALIDRMRIIGEGRGATVAQVAIAWLLAKQAVSSVVLGASKTEQLADTIAAADQALTATEVAELDALTEPQVRYPTSVADARDQPIAKALAGPPRPSTSSTSDSE